MERYCRSFRESSSNNNNNNSSSYSDSKVREPWRLGGGDPQLLGGFSWPPRSYTCSFCKREFRSAQALGGHMNVHRRDRAMLRQSPPWDPPSPNPNPNPKPSTNIVPNLNIPPPSHATETKISPLMTYTFPSMVCPLARLSSSSSSTSSAEVFHDDLRAERAMVGVGELKVLMEEEDRKEREVVRLELEIGQCGHLKEDLDLELRLGYT